MTSEQPEQGPRYHAPECVGGLCKCGYSVLEAENERLRVNWDRASAILLDLEAERDQYKREIEELAKGYEAVPMLSYTRALKAERDALREEVYRMSDRLNFCQAILGCMNGPLWYVSSRHGKAWSVCQEHLGQCINSLYQRDPDSITVSKWYGEPAREQEGE